MRIKNVIYIYLISSILFPKEGNAKGCSNYHKLHSFHMPARWCSKSFKVGFRHQICILSPCIFNLYAEYIMQNARLDEAKVGIKIARRHINNLRYTDDTTLVAESKEKLKSFMMKLKEESGKAGLKLNIQEMKIMAAAASTPFQSCLTLCDPTYDSPPGSTIPGILQARILEWVAISFSNACMHAKLLQSCPTLGDPMDSSPPGSSVCGIL